MWAHVGRGAGIDLSVCPRCHRPTVTRTALPRPSPSLASARAPPARLQEVAWPRLALASPTRAMRRRRRAMCAARPRCRQHLVSPVHGAISADPPERVNES